MFVQLFLIISLARKTLHIKHVLPLSVSMLKVIVPFVCFNIIVLILTCIYETCEKELFLLLLRTYKS